MSLAKQESNGNLGEARTNAILGQRFWTLSRNVDIEGADHLVQLKADTLTELFERKKRIEVFGVVQSKYFENNNQVKVRKEYVVDNEGNSRDEFFIMLHTSDGDYNEINYFFSADEIISEFNETEKFYTFSLTKERQYEKFKNIDRELIFKEIEDGIKKSEVDRNNSFMGFIDVYDVYFELTNNEKWPSNLSKTTIEILKKLEKDDIELVNKFLSLLVKVNEYYCFFPYDGSCLEMNGTDNVLELPFDTEDIVFNNKGTSLISKSKFYRTAKNELFFEQGTLYDIEIEANDEVYIYPATERYITSKRILRELKNRTNPIIVKGVLVKDHISKTGNRQEYKLHPISAKKEKGYIKHFISNIELSRVAELGIINFTQIQTILKEDIEHIYYFNDSISIKYLNTPFISRFCREIIPLNTNLVKNEDYKYFLTH